MTINDAVEAACRATIHPLSEPSDAERGKMRLALAAAYPELVAEIERLRAELSRYQSIMNFRSGATTTAVIAAFGGQREWSVVDLRQRIKSTPKELYNALGYLTRKKRIQRLAYGRYARATLDAPKGDAHG